MFAFTAMQGLGHQLRQGRAFLWCVLASMALHALVLFGLDPHISLAPPEKSLLVLSARLVRVAAAPIEQPSVQQSMPTFPQEPDHAPAPTKPEAAPPPPKPEAPPPPLTPAQTPPSPNAAPMPRPPKAAPIPRPKTSKPAPLPRLSPSIAAPVETARAAPTDPAVDAPTAVVPEAPPAAASQAGSGRPVPSGLIARTPASSASEVDSGTLDVYRRALIVATRRYKRYPAIAMEKGWQGKVEVHMVIGANGMLARASIKTSSGHEVLDNQAVRMLKKGKTTVQIPPGLRGREFSVDVPVIFSLDNPNS